METTFHPLYLPFGEVPMADARFIASNYKIEAMGQRRSSPHFLRGLYDEAELADLLLVGEGIALDG